MFVVDGGFKNIFVYQPPWNKFDIKQPNGEYSISIWKSKEVYNSGL